MSLRSSSLIFLGSLFANPTVGLTGWWTWSPYTLTPHFAYQDPGSGSILHSSCNSNGSANFPTDEPHKFDLKVKPKPASPLAIVGWWDDDLETPIASIFYQGSDDSLVIADFECDYETGDYVLDPEGEYKFSGDAGAPSVHEKTGLAATELGDSGGYRLFYHDENGLVCLLAFDDDTDWQYRGPVSKKKAGSKSLATVQTNGVNVSVAFPFDDEDITVARFRERNEAKWGLESFPTSFESSTLSNKSDQWSFTLDSSKGTPFSLDSFDIGSAHLGIASNGEQQLSIFYIGTDRILHRFYEEGDGWKLDQNMTADEWPKADDDSASFALVSALDSDEVWIYYRSDGDIIELYQDEAGTWAEPKKVSTESKNSSTDGVDETSDGTESDQDSDPVETTDSSGDDQGDQKPSGLSTGAKAGIAVGIVAGLGGSLILLFTLFRRRRRNASREAKFQDSDQESRTPESNMAYVHYNHGGRSTEASDLLNRELPPTPQELPCETKYELLGDVAHARAELGDREHVLNSTDTK